MKKNQDQNKILVVEDDPLIATDLTETLKGYDYTVLGPFDSGEKVLQEIAKLQPNFVLMDINLKGEMDGIKTAEEIQKVISVPIVFLSALNDEATLQRAKLTNPYGYLIKPYDAAELRSTIELTLHRFRNEGAEVSHAEHPGEVSIGELADSARPTDILNFLSTLSFFESVPESNLEALSQACSIRSIDAGQFLIFEGEKAKGTFIPLSGRISVTKTAESGKELIVALLAPGDPFGLFYTIPSFATSTSAKTQIDSRVIWIPISEWNNFVTGNPIVYRNIAHALSERLTSSYTLSSSLAHARVEGRIIHTLVALLPEFGKSSGPTVQDTGRIFITRKELSELTGTTPETAIRVTKNLEREGLLDLTRPGIIKIPSVKKLKQMIAG